jgi:hypothetical protein
MFDLSIFEVKPIDVRQKKIFFRLLFFYIYKVVVKVNIFAKKKSERLILDATLINMLAFRENNNKDH